MAVRADREKSKMQEKYQTVLAQMLREEDNRYCVDCDMKSPRWASWNIGIFICIRCAGFHRNLGVHISKVKSVNLDSWTGEQIASVQAMGNSRARAVYEANLPDGFRRPQADTALEAFIRAKYEQRKWIAKEWIPPEITRMEAELNQRQDENQPEIVEKVPRDEVSPKKRPNIKPLIIPVAKPPSEPVVTEDLLNLDEPSVPPATTQSTLLDPLHDLFLPPSQPQQETTTTNATDGPMTKEKIMALFNTPYPSMVQSPTFPSAMNFTAPQKSPSFNNHLYQQFNPSMMSYANTRSNASPATMIPSMPMRPVTEYMPASSDTFWQ